VAKPLPVAPRKRQRNNNESGIDASAYQAVSKAVALEHGVSYVDMRGAFAPGFTLQEKTRVHLTPTAQEQFKSILAGALPALTQ